MPDSLFLKGVKDVQNHTGSEMTLAIPSRGGDTHAIRRWYADGNPAAYVSCTVFDVDAGGTTIKLAIETGASTELQIEHDGAGNFDFPKHRSVRQAATFTETYDLLDSFVFPSVPGAKVKTAGGGGFDPSSGDIALELPTFTVGESTEVGLKSSSNTRLTVCDDVCLAGQGYTSTWIITGDAFYSFVNPCKVQIIATGNQFGVYACLVSPDGTVIECVGTQNADITPDPPANPDAGRIIEATLATLPEDQTNSFADGPVVWVPSNTQLSTDYATVNLSDAPGTGATVRFSEIIEHDGEKYVPVTGFAFVGLGSGYTVGEVIGMRQNGDDFLFASVDRVSA